MVALDRSPEYKGWTNLVFSITFIPQPHNLNNICRGPIDNAKNQTWKLRPVSDKKIFDFFTYIKPVKLVTRSGELNSIMKNDRIHSQPSDLVFDPR